ncbi:MAG: hypothetical protein EAZ53_04925 [Bacteroidetes bacterium]|nr:MAG: hypothetical protein EAZ53_04925 [Bacteroidota bacterium]
MGYVFVHDLCVENKNYRKVDKIDELELLKYYRLNILEVISTFSPVLFVKIKKKIPTTILSQNSEHMLFKLPLINSYDSILTVKLIPIKHDLKPFKAKSLDVIEFQLQIQVILTISTDFEKVSSYILDPKNVLLALESQINTEIKKIFTNKKVDEIFNNTANLNSEIEKKHDFIIKSINSPFKITNIIIEKISFIDDSLENYYTERLKLKQNNDLTKQSNENKFEQNKYDNNLKIFNKVNESEIEGLRDSIEFNSEKSKIIVKELNANLELDILEKKNIIENKNLKEKLTLLKFRDGMLLLFPEIYKNIEVEKINKHYVFLLNELELKKDDKKFNSDLILKIFDLEKNATANQISLLKEIIGKTYNFNTNSTK